MNTNTNPHSADKTPKPGTYRAVLADPLWSLQQKGSLGAANPYDLISDERMLGLGTEMKEIMAENSFCFLWVPTATVPLSIEVLEAWGYKYTGFYFWANPRLMFGNIFRNSGELLLLDVRDRGTKVAFKGQSNWGMHTLQAHSQKPKGIHLIVERLVGEGPFLELFARRPVRLLEPSRPWDIWGNECGATVSLGTWGYSVPADEQFNDAPASVAETQM